MSSFRALFIMALLILLVACASPAVPGEEPATQPAQPAQQTQPAQPAATVVPIVPTAVVQETAPAPDNLEIFISELETALAQQDYAMLTTFMSDPIGVGAWRSEWRQYTPGQLVDGLQSGGVPAATAVRFTEFGDEEITQLIGQPPATMLGPDANVAAVHGTGWGADGTDEAILLIVDEDGAYAWKAFLYTSGAFAEPQGDMFPVVETDVNDVTAMQDVVIYAGPGAAYEQVGGVFDGQQALVTGQSPDGAWWRVICPDDTVGDCWVTADTAYTMPAGAP